MQHTVVIVEDEEELREMMREALEMNGYAVVTAVEGQDGLDALERAESVCLVLLDLLMPGMNGWDFIDRMRARPKFADTPVVVHSSAPSRAPASATRVLQKPVSFQRLLGIVREYCTPEATE